MKTVLNNKCALAVITLMLFMQLATSVHASEHHHRSLPQLCIVRSTS